MMDATQTAQLHEAFGGQMSSAELRFCNHLRELFGAFLAGRAQFLSGFMMLSVDLQEIRRHGYNLDVADASGFRPSIAALATAPDASDRRFRLSDPERAFVEDLDGLVDFAVRNGLGFRAVLSGLYHDVGEIARNEWSIERALATFFTPKATGWARRNAEPIGEPDDMEG
jgi:hypothetical protein